MVRVLYILLTFITCQQVFGANMTIIESASYLSQPMAARWQTLVTGMGHTAAIVPQTTLDNNAFFATTDVLIVSSSAIALPANRRNTILQFIQSGKSVYIQSEYLASYDGNQTFAFILGSLGATFSWGSTIAGDLQPVNVLGTFANTNTVVTPLSYYWYSVNGIGDCNTVNFLEQGGVYHGFQYVPTNTAYGSIITTTDQDWVNSNTSLNLMRNIITHLLTSISVNPNAVGLGNDTTLCTGATLVLDATQAGATYLWQDNSTAPTYTVTQAGTYWVRVTNTCTVVYDTIVVTYNATTGLNLGNDTILCTGATLTLDATETGATYLWQDNSTAATYTVTQAGTYWVRRTTASCGSVSDTIVVSYATVGSLNLGNDTTLCSGATHTLDATMPNATYVWQDNSTAATYNVTQPGTYSVQATSNCGVFTDNIVITYSAPVTVDLGNDTTLCPTATLTLNATTPNATYLWQDNSTTATYTVTQAGTYSVQVTTTCGTITDNIVVTYTAPIVVDLGNDTALCAGQTLTLDATTPNATYVWQNNSTAPTFTVTQAGTYSVQVTTSCGVFTDNIVVVNIAPIVINLGNDTALCTGATLTLDATSPNATYLWQDNSTNATYTVTQAGTYSVQVTNSCGSISDNIVVSYITPSSLNLGNDTTLCPGATITLDATTPNATYLWQNNSTAPTFTVIQAGTYSVQVTTSCGTLTDNIVVAYTAPVTLDLGNDTTLCTGAALMLNATTPNATYLWQDNSTNATYTVTQAGNYSVQVTTGCGTLSDNILVAYSTPAAINLGNDTILCPGVTMLLDATNANATYLWHNNATAAVFNVTQAGNYSVSVSNACGTVSDAVRVDYIAPVTIDLGNDTSICPSAALTLDASIPNATYVWQDGATTATYAVSVAGTYSVQVTTTCGMVSDDISITNLQLPTVNIGIDSLYCEGDIITLDASSPLASSYLWHDGSIEHTFDLVESGTASVTVTNGCGTATDAVTAVFENCECYLYMPNSFTPNGDGRNDFLAPITGCEFEGYEFSVFDRWGELIYTATSTTAQGWDGTYRGERAGPGVYVYHIQYLPNDVAKGSTKKTVKGSVTLLRY